jgi:hypothetical protein
MESKNVQPLSKVKIATILAYAAIVLALVFLYLNSPVTGYELSIYTSIPLFWVSIFIAISIAITLLVYQVYKKNYINFWLIFFSLLLSYFIILTLPVSRGYFLYGSNDLMGHYSRIINLVNSGSIGDNYYPIVHILGAEISLFCPEITTNVILEIIPPIFSIIFVLFIYYLARVIFKREDYSVMAACLSFIPLYSYYQIILYPHAIAILLLPLIFYLYFNLKNLPSLKILLIIMMVMQVFVHVIPALIIFGCLVSAEIIKIVFNRIATSSKFNISFNTAAISLIVFFAWWSSYSVFGETNKAVIWLVGESAAVPRMQEVENAINLGQQSFIELFFKMFGNQLILAILTIISIIIMVIYYIKRKNDVNNGIILSGILLTSALIYLLYFLSSGMATVGRFFGANYGIWAMPVIIAFLFTSISRTKKLIFIITVFIIIITIISMLTVYKSDWVLQPNWQVTQQDITANNWESVRGSDSLSSGVIASPWAKSNSAIIPAHFGYDKNNQFGDLFSRDTLIYYGEKRQILANKNPILNESTLNNVWALAGCSDDDYVQLGKDKNVHFLYDNGEVKYLLVNGLKKA